MGPGSASAFTGFRLGPLTVDLDRGVVVSGEQGASGLTPRAEDLLLLLSRRAGTLVTREDILETVWAGRVVEDSAISHCVWQIRRVIDDAGKDILQTRPKRGYVLVVADSAWIRNTAVAAEITGERAADAPAEAAPTAAPAAVLDPADGPSAALAGTRAEETAPDDSTATAAGTADDMVSVEASALAPDSTAPDSAAPDSLASDSLAPDSSVPAAPPPRNHPAQPAPSTRPAVPRWRALAVFVLLLALVGTGYALWRTQRVVFDPATDASVAVLAPPSLDWLRDTLLRRTIEQAHLRDIELVVFSAEQTAHPFGGPHLEVRIENEDPQALEATLTLNQGRAQVRERYRGPAEGLPDALQALLSAHAAEARHAPGPAIDAYVAGRLAEARFDRATALLEYRRALQLDAGFTDARVAMAGLLFDFGRAEDAREAAADLLPLEQTDPIRRCRIERLFARIAPERLGPAPCPRAGMLARVERLQLREALRGIERLERTPAGAGEWLEQEDAMILSLLRLQELERAEYEIDRASEIARRAGWPYAALRLQNNLGAMHMHRGERRAAAAAQRRVAAGFADLGDLASAAEGRIWVQRAEPILPGPALAQRRVELRRIVEQSQVSGNMRAEIEALLLLARMDRDRPEVWRGHLERARARIRDARLDGGNSLHPYFLVGEMVAARHYRDALAEIAVLQRVPRQHPRGPAWALYLQMESHFWRDELEQAVSAIDAMERGGLDITASPNPCFNAWVLTEAGRRDRANAYLERCQDGKRSPEQTDFGLVAAARQRELDGSPARAWPLLRPRLDALLAIPEPSRQEAEALALIARHAARLPGADPALLTAAADTVDRVAALDGAGPTLRLGATLLHEAVCQTRGGTASCARSAAAAAWRREEPLAARLLGPLGGVKAQPSS